MRSLLVATLTLATLAAAPAMAQDNKSDAAKSGDKGMVAGKPILTTESLDALIKQREKWGDKPSKTYKDS